MLEPSIGFYEICVAKIRVNLLTCLRNSWYNMEFCSYKKIKTLARSSSMVKNSYQSQIYAFWYDKPTQKAACLFWALSSLVDLSRETCHTFWSRSCTLQIYIYATSTLEVCNHHYIFKHHLLHKRHMLIPPLAIYHYKERHGLLKKKRGAKAL